MSEDIQTVDKNEKWFRGLYMLLFLFIMGFAKGLIFFISAIQFIILVATGEANEQLKLFGQGLATYLYDTVQFLTFNTEQKPFPFAEWLNKPPSSSQSTD